MSIYIFISMGTTFAYFAPFLLNYQNAIILIIKKILNSTFYTYRQKELFFR